MDTVLIVDGDRSVRQYLRSLIRASGVNVEVVMECGDGASALDTVRRYRVDVMFTAIHVPGMDGVELMRHVHGLPHPPLTVVVTGSDEIHHVIEMMRNGAEEYVLKPVEPERMTEILQTLEAKVTADRRRSRMMDLLTMRMVFSFLEDRRPSPEELALLEQVYEPLIAETGYVVCLFHAGASIRTSARLLLHRDTQDGTLCILGERDLGAFLRSELPGFAAGVSAAHRRAEELPQAHDEAMAARAQAFCRGQHIFAPAPETAAAPEAERILSEQARSQRLQLLGTRKGEELAAQWEALFQAAAEGQVPPDRFFGELQIFSEEAPKLYRGSLDREDMHALDQCVHPLAFPSLAEFQHFFMQWLLAFHGRLTARLEFNRNQARIAEAIEYMEANYAADLNMAVVSNYISMNYSLFSHLFKLQTGVSFVTYLKQLRIREAQRLLAETDLKVVDVSRRVGYVNEKNFMKVFKSLSGISPSEYRRNMQERK